MIRLFQKDREREKEEVVSSVVRTILSSHYGFSHTETTEILNRINLRVFERKKERRDALIAEAREVQNSLKEIKI